MNEQEFNAMRLRYIEEYSHLVEVYTHEFELSKERLLNAKAELLKWREINYAVYLLKKQSQ